MLHFHRTSLLKSQAQTLVNTVNTVGIMGKGLASEFKTRFPQMFREYAEVCRNGNLSAGSFWLWKGETQWVLNFSTKRDWRRPSKLAYVESGLLEFREKYEALGIREVAFPRLGCGNGGLDWSDVKPLMVEMLRDLPIDVYIHDFEKQISDREHDFPLLQKWQPKTFDAFCDDIKRALKLHDGRIRAIKLNHHFNARWTERNELRTLDEPECLIAAEEDLYRIWTMLMKMPVSKFEMPESVGQHALEFMSILSKLPYARPVNIASKSGRNRLAIEFVNAEPAARLTDSQGGS